MNSEHTGCQHFIHAVGDSVFAVGCVEHDWIEMVRSRSDAQSRQAVHEKSAMKMRFITATAKRCDAARPSRTETRCPICRIDVPKGGHYHMAEEILGARK